MPKVTTATARYRKREFELSGIGADTQIDTWRRGGFYEIKLLQQIEKMKRKGVYLDVGANFGNHSVFFANFCPADLVIAVEPYPSTIPILESNLRRHVKKFLLIPNAVSDRNETVSMFMTADNGYGSARIKNHDDGNIEAKTIDTILDDLDGVTVMKIDVEGANVIALRGAKKLLSKSKPVVIAECFRKNEFKDIDTILRKYGYKTDGRSWCASRTCIWMPPK